MTRHDYLDKLDANLSGRASDVQTHYQDMSAGYEAPRTTIKCSTIGCRNQAIALLVWHDGYDAEPVCGSCAEGYARRPVLMRVAHIDYYGSVTR